MPDPWAVAHEVAERALADIKADFPEAQIEDGYDLDRQKDGSIVIRLSHDVVLYVNSDGEEDSCPVELYERYQADPEPDEGYLERQAEQVGVPFWMRV